MDTAREGPQLTGKVEVGFWIPGRPCADHRPRSTIAVDRSRATLILRQAQFRPTSEIIDELLGRRVRSGGGKPAFFIRTHPSTDYETWKSKVGAHAGQAAFQADWQLPDPKRELVLYLRFYLATWKKGVYRSGKRKGQEARIGRTIPDSNNLIKSLEDGCEGKLYHNDRVVTSLPWPGYFTFVRRVSNPSYEGVRVGLTFLDQLERERD